jgi:F-type H+-transporting ATPase subunit b
VGSLGLDLATFVGQLISFLILLGLLTLFGYKPVRKMLDERSQRIKESIERAEATKKKYEQAESAIQKQLEEAHKKSQDIITQATALGDKIKEEARKAAKKETEVIYAQANLQLEKEQDKAISELRKEFVDTVILATEKVISETLDEEKHRNLIEKILEESTIFRKS